MVVARGIIDDDVGVVDDDSDGQDQPEQGRQVDRESHSRHDRERTDQ